MGRHILFYLKKEIQDDVILLHTIKEIYFICYLILKKILKIKHGANFGIV